MLPRQRRVRHQPSLPPSVPCKQVDAHTPLVPFYAHNTSSLGKAVAGWGKGTFVTSAMLRDWRRLAYTYPDVDAWEAAARSPAYLLARVLDAYR